MVCRASHIAGALERITELFNYTFIHCAQFTIMREKSFQYKTTQFCCRILAWGSGFTMFSVSASLFCLRCSKLSSIGAQILPRSGGISNSLTHAQLKQRDHIFRHQLGYYFVVPWWWPSFQ